MGLQLHADVCSDAGMNGTELLDACRVMRIGTTVAQAADLYETCPAQSSPLMPTKGSRIFNRGSNGTAFSAQGNSNQLLVLYGALELALSCNLQPRQHQ